MAGRGRAGWFVDPAQADKGGVNPIRGSTNTRKQKERLVKKQKFRKQLIIR
ncbi:hypothetical protein NOC27_3377 [Nitrosococcus oceani AFC27]|nr:hypothetical protein NOC27_3377 [Nitrosococcus oceani AFC27]